MKTLKGEKTEAQQIIDELRSLRNEVKNIESRLSQIECLLDPMCDDGSDDRDDADMESLLQSPRY